MVLREHCQLYYDHHNHGQDLHELIVTFVINDDDIQVEAKHEEKTGDGHSYSTRSFQQSFTLPRGVDLETISSALSKVSPSPCPGGWT